jgi:hypothetical protein
MHVDACTVHRANVLGPPKNHNFQLTLSFPLMLPYTMFGCNTGIILGIMHAAFECRRVKIKNGIKFSLCMKFIFHNPPKIVAVKLPNLSSIIPPISRASDRGRICIFYAFKMKKTHWE